VVPNDVGRERAALARAGRDAQVAILYRGIGQREPAGGAPSPVLLAAPPYQRRRRWAIRRVGGFPHRRVNPASLCWYGGGDRRKGVSWHVGAVQVIVTVSDPSSGAAQTLCGVGGSASTPYAGAFLVSGDGSHAVQYCGWAE